VTITVIGLQGATEVTIDQATVGVENPPAVNNDGTQLTVFMTVPVDEVTGSSTITVITPQGNPTTNISLVQFATILARSPSTLILGQRTMFTITGTNLQGATQVTIDRTTAVVENPPAVNEDGTQVMVYITVPTEAATGTTTVTVFTPQGNPITNIEVVAPVTITSISPPTLILGQRTQITITGTNLQGATQVTVDRTTAVVENPPAVNEDGTQVMVNITVPTEAGTGTATVTVFTPQGNPTTNIELVAPATIASISPPTLRLGQRTQITITGTNLQGATQVTIDRTTAVVENPPTVNEDRTQVMVYITVPTEAATGTATVTIFTPQGNPTANIELVRLATITSISPPTLILGQRIQITITGSNLQGATEVTIDVATADVENPPTVNEHGTQVMVYITVPAEAATGTATVTVFTPQGNPTANIELVAPATITSISPPTLILGQRTQITITGSNLQGAIEVTIDRVTADIENPPTVNEDGTQVMVYITVPTEEATGTATVTVLTPQGNPSKNIQLVLVVLGTGDLQATLTWDTDETDLDIHLIEPDSTHVFFSNQEGPTASLDVDDRDGFGPENIFVPPDQADSGIYEIFIVYYSDSVPTTATISIKVFADTPLEMTATFTRVLSSEDMNLGVNVANVAFPDGKIEETSGTRDVSGSGQRDIGFSSTGKYKVVKKKVGKNQ